MVDFVKNALATLTDKLGDGTLVVLDEMKFWGEVLMEFMEMDKNGSDQMVEDYRKELREQIEDTKEYQKDVDRIMQQEEEREAAEEVKSDEDDQGL